MKARYMMATKAEHKLGDISRDEADLCFVEREEEEYYIGSWVEGFGFFNVKFPKATTRELTPSEMKRYDGRGIFIGNQPQPIAVIDVTVGK